MRRSIQVAIVAAVAGLSSSSIASAQVSQSLGNRFGRWAGYGWSEGQHAYDSCPECARGKLGRTARRSASAGFTAPSGIPADAVIVDDGQAIDAQLYPNEAPTVQSPLRKIFAPSKAFPPVPTPVPTPTPTPNPMPVPELEPEAKATPETATEARSAPKSSRNSAWQLFGAMRGERPTKSIGSTRPMGVNTIDRSLDRPAFEQSSSVHVVDQTPDLIAPETSRLPSVLLRETRSATPPLPVPVEPQPEWEREEADVAMRLPPTEGAETEDAETEDEETGSTTSEREEATELPPVTEDDALLFD